MPYEGLPPHGPRRDKDKNRMRLDQVGELALLDWIRKRAGDKREKGKGLLLGIGDDAAAFKLAGKNGKTALATQDLMAEGVHFDLRYFTPYQLGFKLVSVNVSDIYAMGGAPRLALFAIAAPPETEAAFIKKIFEGVFAALDLYGARLAGGDLSASRSGLVLDMSVIGEAAKVIRRAGAKPGDGVFVTGPLGDSACGREILKRIARPLPIGRATGGGRKKEKISGLLPGWLDWETVKPLVTRHLMPVAKKPPKRASAMLDVSDGLLIDAFRLCKESGVGVKIYEEKIPVSKQMRRAAGALGMDPLAIAKIGGEDYELLYTAPIGPRGEKSNDGGILIGEIVPSGFYMVEASGKMKRFRPEGYRHFN